MAPPTPCTLTLSAARRASKSASHRARSLFLPLAGLCALHTPLPPVTAVAHACGCPAGGASPNPPWEGACPPCDAVALTDRAPARCGLCAFITRSPTCRQTPPHRAAAAGGPGRRAAASRRQNELRARPACTPCTLVPAPQSWRGPEHQAPELPASARAHEAAGGGDKGRAAGQQPSSAGQCAEAQPRCLEPCRGSLCLALSLGHASVVASLPTIQPHPHHMLWGCTAGRRRLDASAPLLPRPGHLQLGGLTTPLPPSRGWHQCAVEPRPLRPHQATLWAPLPTLHHSAHARRAACCVPGRDHG
jgi:hypothetical protein